MGAGERGLAGMGLTMFPDSCLRWGGPTSPASEWWLFITVCHCLMFDAAFGDDKTKPHLASSEGISVSWPFFFL